MQEPEAHTENNLKSAPRSCFGPGLSRGRELGLLGLILLAFFALSFSSLIQKSVTVDEFAHLPAGLSYLRTGDFRVEPLNSPLIRMLAALPLAWSQARLPLRDGWEKSQPWILGYEFMYFNPDSYQSLFVRARAVIVVLGALLIALIWGFARSLYGPESGLAAASLAAFNPNLMAHSQLVTGDVGGALFFFAAVLMAWAFCRRPTWPRALAAGIVLGLALLAKPTSILLLPLLPALVLGYRWTGGTTLSRHKAAMGTALVFFSAWLTVCSGYFGHGIGAPLRTFDFQSYWFRRIAPHLPPGLPVLLPADCAKGLDLLSGYTQQPYPGYLFGRVTDQRVPYYYLVALAVKTPVAALILMALGIGSLMFAGKRSWPDELFLLAPALLAIGFVSGFSNVQLGVRHLLPAFPFLFILASRPLARFFMLRFWARAALVFLLACNLASNLAIYPDYLAYFNFAAGGPSRGHRILIDSNLDWGQDLIGLKQYLDQEGISQICLAYFGRVDPKLYGIQATLPMPGRTCEWVAISVSLLMGKPYLLMDGPQPTINQPGRFAWLQKEKPVAVIGHSIWIFRPGPKTVPP